MPRERLRSSTLQGKDEKKVPLHGELNDLRVQFFTGNVQVRQTHGQRKPSRSGAARIDVKHASLFCDCRPVRMATHHHLEARARRADVDLFHVVQHVDRHVADFHHFPIRKRARPVGLIIVSAHGDDRRDLIQSTEHVLAADVAGVKNHVDVFECLECLRPNEAMSVGDNSNQFLSDH